MVAGGLWRGLGGWVLWVVWVIWSWVVGRCGLGGSGGLGGVVWVVWVWVHEWCGLWRGLGGLACGWVHGFHGDGGVDTGGWSGWFLVGVIIG